MGDAQLKKWLKGEVNIILFFIHVTAHVRGAH